MRDQPGQATTGQRRTRFGRGLSIAADCKKTENGSRPYGRIGEQKREANRAETWFLWILNLRNGEQK